MSRASDLEAARLAKENIDKRCDMILADIAGDAPEHIRDAPQVVLEDLARLMLAEATYVAEQRKSGWKSRSDAHTAAGRILEQWARDLAAYLERDKPPMRPPLETIPPPDRHAHLDPADGPISAQITSGLLSQVPVDHASSAWNEGYADGMGGLRPERKHDPNYADGWQTGDAERSINDEPVTPDVARSIREAKTVDDKLDVAFGRPSLAEAMRAGSWSNDIDPVALARLGAPPDATMTFDATFDDAEPGETLVTITGRIEPGSVEVRREPLVHITAAPANYAWCDVTTGARGYVGSATCPDCIARYDAYDEAANKALALNDPTGPMTGVSAAYLWPDPATDSPTLPEVMQFIKDGVDAMGGPEVMAGIPQFSEPGPAPVRETQQRMTFDAVREHGMARMRGEDHRSYSQVNAFAECGVRYALGDLETPAWWNVGGTAVHYACETINRQAGPWSDHGIETLWTNCLNRATSEAIAEHPTVGPDRWRAAKKGAEGYDWWRVNGVDMVRRWVARLTWLYDQGWRVAEFNGVPAIEYDCPMWIGSVKVENIIDLVLTRKDGTLLIVDAKSGASAPDSTAQLGQYAHALGRHRVPQPGEPMRQNPIYGAYWLARTDEMRPWEPSKATTGMDLRELHPWSEIEYLITTMDTAERQGLYLPNKSKTDKFGCGSCGVRGLCPVGPS